MGKFANAPEGDSLQGGWIGEAPAPRCEPWNGETGFEAMGHVVPAFRKTAAERHLKAMGFNRPGESELRFDLVARMSASIERDASHEALEQALKSGLDATGCYRLLAVLLCEEEPVAPQESPATYLDLVDAA